MSAMWSGYLSLRILSTIYGGVALHVKAAAGTPVARDPGSEQ